MAIIDKAVEEYNGVLRWKNRQVAKFNPKSELGLGLKRKALLFGRRKNKQQLGPRMDRFQGQMRQTITEEIQAPASTTGSFKLIGSR
ncbi:MAG: hypothetical protein UY48_C0013G0027 [Candidatus Gottesmanbacteria bacterium GW2011_GWB1_49_7]|uniref:Uncharacterized protein n=1 Tax=Candidatus Gottesmanbacteria bacterium GW2011_GWB1_49_7 TaxID=1618448 RepID=A0A0G1VZ53_9BACT|nr:MAG: hypothetical protein UY48_C0013G0027 [Candidatus Gottesmanbacteria bacterium GW2011_GWB1_49_7]